jgi:hypothetical protein
MSRPGIGFQSIDDGEPGVVGKSDIEDDRARQVARGQRQGIGPLLWRPGPENSVHGPGPQESSKRVRHPRRSESPAGWRPAGPDHPRWVSSPPGSETGLQGWGECRRASSSLGGDCGWRERAGAGNGADDKRWGRSTVKLLPLARGTCQMNVSPQQSNEFTLRWRVRVPVPPYFRLVVPSAWQKGSKISSCWSCGMPMPLS